MCLVNWCHFGSWTGGSDGTLWFAGMAQLLLLSAAVGVFVVSEGGYGGDGRAMLTALISSQV